MTDHPEDYSRHRRGVKTRATPAPLTQNHKQPPGAAAQPAEPGPNPARRHAEPTVYRAHPTHGAGTWPHRTQLQTAARKTTLNTGQCVRQPREGRGRNRQAPPPPQKKGRGEGEKARKQPTAAQPTANTTTGGQAPPPGKKKKKGGGDPRRGTGEPPTENRQHEASNSGPRGKGTRKKKKKKREPPAQPERKGMEGRRPQSQKKKKKKEKKKPKRKKKNTPRQPSQDGLGTGETRAQHTRPHRAPEPETAGGKRGAHETTHVPKAGRNRSPTTNTTNSRH